MNGIETNLKVQENWTEENIEIDENTVEEEEIMEETTEPVAKTIESVAQNNFSVVIAPDLTREGRNRRPPIWLENYNSNEGSSKEDEEYMAFLIISNPVNFEEAVKSRKWRLAMDEEIKFIEKIKHGIWWFYPLEQRK